MEFILEGFAAVECAFAAGAGACGVAALDDEAGDEAMEDGAVVVAVETVLEEVARGEGGLLCEEFKGEVAGGGAEDGFGGGLGFEVVEAGHGGRCCWVVLSLAHCIFDRACVGK